MLSVHVGATPGADRLRGRWGARRYLVPGCARRPAGASRDALDAISDATVGRHPHGPLDLVIDPLLVTQAQGRRRRLPHDRRDRGRRATRPSARQAAHLSAGAGERGRRRRERSRPSRTRTRTRSCPPCCTASSRHRSPPSGSAGPASSRRLGAAPITTVAKPAGGQLTDDVLDWLARVDNDRRAGGRRHDRSKRDTGLPRPRADGPGHDIVGNGDPRATRPRHPGAVRPVRPLRRSCPGRADRARRARGDLEGGAGPTRTHRPRHRRGTAANVAARDVGAAPTADHRGSLPRARDRDGVGRASRSPQPEHGIGAGGARKLVLRSRICGADRRSSRSTSRPTGRCSDQPATSR